MKLSRKKQFFIVLTAFLALGIPFKVMVLIKGFTEVRPVNAIPPIAGLICGPVGAIACGIGNLIADLFGTFGQTSVLGLFGNVAAAYLPYRLWHIYSDEEPNLHKNINIIKYILICYSSALTVSWFLGFGINYYFNTWIKAFYTYVLFNNFGFSIVLGMPLMIMLTSDDVKIVCVPKPSKYILLKNESFRKIIPVIYTLILTVIMALVLIFNISPQQNVFMGILSVLGMCGMIAIFV